jgi:8-oxo-dGTP diphosphatase
VEDKKIVQKVVLGGVVFDNNLKVLILQRHDHEPVYPGLWELPSGKRESLEGSETALLREIKEETGINVEIVALVSVFDYQIEKPDEIRDSTQINFLVKMVPNQKVKISDEHQKSAWVGEADLENYNLTDATKKVIKKAFELFVKFNLK